MSPEEDRPQEVSSVPWTDDPISVVEAEMILSTAGPFVRELVGALAWVPDESITAEEIASSVVNPACTTELLHEVVARINRFAEIFGRVWLIESGRDGYVVTPPTAAVLREALLFASLPDADSDL